VIADQRQQFNRNWTPARYAEFRRRLNSAAGTPISFRCSETPVFLPKPLLESMIRYGQELYAQLDANAEYTKASDAAVPARFRVPGESRHPLFVQADFGLVREPDGSLAPKLVEIQGFPSIYALQIAMARAYQEIFDLPGGLTTFLSDLDESSYFELLRKVILNGHAPEHVVLLEIDPYRQKTLPDFLLTQKKLGIRLADLSEVRKRGRKLYLDGVEIKRIYNRVIVDELVKTNLQPDFHFNDELDVEWAGHPNWFFRLSKFSLPWFRHACVPESHFLSDVHEPPTNLGDYVLKPLYSFAGQGVKIGPTREDIAAIPANERAAYILQRRMEFVPTIDTPSGMTKVEVRVMYIWDGGLKPVTTVVRTGRGKMMGVDFNKDLDWVGATAGFYFPNE
jgi:hypothetical protein